MKITRIKVENFCGISSFETDIGDRTFFEGRNRCGKSTIRNAIYWCLTDKLADGSAAEGIRPHDTDGVDIDHVEIVVELTLEANDQSFIIKKTQKQKWTRKRNTDENVFGGNENLYEINGIPKRQKDFTSFIEEIVPPDVLLFGMNPMAFLSLDTKKRRMKLMSMEAFTDEDVIATNPDFEVLRDVLAVGTVDEILTRSRKVIKEKKAEQIQIPARIDELSKRKSSATDESYEEQKARLDAEAAEIQGEIDAANEHERQRKELEKSLYEANLELEAAKQEELRIANSEREAALADKAKVEREISDIAHQIQMIEHENIWSANEQKALKERRTGAVKAKYEEISGSAFDETALVYDEKSEVCPTCGRKYDPSQVAKIRKAFEARKAEEKKAFEANVAKKKAEIIAEANAMKAKEAEWGEKIHEGERKIAALKADLKGLEAKLDDVCARLDKLPSKTVEADSEAINGIVERIESIKAKIAEMAPSNISELSAKKQRIAAEIFAAETGERTNKEISDRIVELAYKQKTLAQEIADEERLMELLQSFDRERVNLLTERVNKHFKVVKFRMFKPLINGGWDSVCDPMVEGSSYFGLLNHGDKILAEIDICMAFQDAAGIKLPIILDDAESVDTWRIPDIDRQLIILRRTDGVARLSVRKE